jgi:uncharacterized phiE125 gp8 family phage protein
VDTAREPGRLALRLGAAWPVPARAANGVMVEYAAGYGTSGADVPEAIRLAIRQLAAFWYERRGDDGAAEIPASVQALLAPYRLQGLGA